LASFLKLSHVCSWTSSATATALLNEHPVVVVRTGVLFDDTVRKDWQPQFQVLQVTPLPCSHHQEVRIYAP
jgi:hypothetical protein